MTTIGRNIKTRLYVKWIGLLGYDDESANIINYSGQIRLAPPLTTIIASRSMVDQVSITLHNADNRYSSLLTSATLYTQIGEGAGYQSPMYLQVSIDGGSNYYTIFTGVVKSYTESSKTAREVGQVTLDCRSVEEVLLNQKIKSTYTEFSDINSGAETESDILARWIVDAGLSSGDYDLDTGLFVIPYAWLNDESPIENGWDIASACGGRFYMRHSDGKLIYENKTAWLSKSSVQTITRNDYAGLRIKYPDTDLFKSVKVQISAHSLLPSADVFTLGKPILVTAGATITVEFDLDKPVLSWGSITYSATTTGGRNISSDITIISTLYAQHVSYAITNANTSDAAYIRLFKYSGQAIDSDTSESATVTSVSSFWDHASGRERSLSNRYVQARAQAASLADMINTQTQTMLQYVEIVDCLGNPQLGIGDRITVNDSKIMSAAKDYFVTSISFRYSSAGYLTTIEACERTQLMPYADSSPGYFVAGTSTVGASSAGRGRLFF